jgi:uncharacterized protein DUF955
METLRAGGRRYSDPDVVALIRAGGGLADPRSLVLTQARRLNERYRMFDASGVMPFHRLEHLASLVGLEVRPMNLERRREERRDAVLILNGNGQGKRGQILFNPDRPTGRTAFSIAHEIGHTFFPMTSGGARFREMSDSDSREANELERLCDLAASELLMPVEDFRRAVGCGWALGSVPRLAERFGSSYEATAFRLASAYPGVAAAGLLKYRLRKEEQRAIEARRIAAQQESLFCTPAGSARLGTPVPKYRRQSFHTSDAFPSDLVVRWNKSFGEESIVYRVADAHSPLRAREPLPTATNIDGALEAMRAPYQRDDADPQHSDIIFLWIAGDCTASS